MSLKGIEISFSLTNVTYVMKLVLRFAKKQNKYGTRNRREDWTCCFAFDVNIGHEGHVGQWKADRPHFCTSSLFLFCLILCL